MQVDEGNSVESAKPSLKLHSSHPHDSVTINRKEGKKEKKIINIMLTHLGMQTKKIACSQLAKQPFLFALTGPTPRR